jgi:putative endonuclease
MDVNYMADKNCFVYIIECKNGCFYTGITDNIVRRWLEHYFGKGATYVKNFGFKSPIFLNVCFNKSEAMKMENRIKKMSKQAKLKLILNNNDKELLSKFKEDFYNELHKKIYK